MTSRSKPYMTPEQHEEQFMKRIIKEGDHWILSSKSTGKDKIRRLGMVPYRTIKHELYGQVVNEDATTKAERYAYAHFKLGVDPDSIPHNEVVRQTCGNPLCVNPDHLELVPKRINPDVLFKEGNTAQKEYQESLTPEERADLNRKIKEGKQAGKAQRQRQQDRGNAQSK
jgi:hypothetical protein